MYAVYFDTDDTEKTVEVLGTQRQSDGRILYKILFLDGWRKDTIIYVDEHQIEIDYST